MFRKLEYWHKFDADDRAAVLALPHTVRTLEHNHYIVREFDRAEYSCVLLSGFAVRHKIVVGGARQIIGQHTGVFPDSMAYVGGGFDAALVRAARAAGYTSARSILRGIATDPPERYKLPVVRIGVHDDVVDLLHGVINPALPTFTERMRGVSDKASNSD